ncbi:hypothetical protein D9C73_012291 [Collichthys lucidus]|uniref:Uncharacterized protein n=1 Tax=Collichthys lucidus TaxID=240159 RepID=A0A4V6AQ24_COLLU|nr:hypothetical protein D9C73_012291 [Collichthys lucidus]
MAVIEEDEEESEESVGMPDYVLGGGECFILLCVLRFMSQTLLIFKERVKKGVVITAHFVDMFTEKDIVTHIHYSPVLPPSLSTFSPVYVTYRRGAVRECGNRREKALWVDVSSGLGRSPPSSYPSGERAAAKPNLGFTAFDKPSNGTGRRASREKERQTWRERERSSKDKNITLTSSGSDFLRQFVSGRVFCDAGETGAEHNASQQYRCDAEEALSSTLLFTYCSCWDSYRL